VRKLLVPVALHAAAATLASASNARAHPGGGM
jgi:hypothetical protein